MSHSSSRVHTRWAELVAEGHRLGDRRFRAEAFELASRLCARARANIERLIAGLSQAGYVFAFPERAHVVDDGSTLEVAAELEPRGVHLPVFLQAWIAEVGSVNLMGSHPDWPRSGYSGLPPAGTEIWYTDPLVLELDGESLRAEHEEWVRLIDECGPTETGPFQLSVAPDPVHKAGVSGGAPYSVDTSAPAVDTLLLYEREVASLFHHVRHALLWGGFPGFAYIDEPIPEPVASLRESLLSL